MPTKHYAVIGRIPGDDEDSCHIFEGNEDFDAVEAFKSELHRYEPKEHLEAIEKFHGETIYINTVLVSDSPITSI